MMFVVDVRDVATSQYPEIGTNVMLQATRSDLVTFRTQKAS
jgi:hypothetical protein